MMSFVNGAYYGNYNLFLLPTYKALIEVLMDLFKDLLKIVNVIKT